MMRIIKLTFQRSYKNVLVNRFFIYFFQHDQYHLSESFHKVVRHILKPQHSKLISLFFFYFLFSIYIRHIIIKIVFMMFKEEEKNVAKLFLFWEHI